MSDQTPRRLLVKLEHRDGRRSAWTGNESDTLVPQHRQGGMGGRRSKHRLSNVVWLESDVNGAIEADPTLQAEAVRRGIKIGGHADPSTVPVEHAVHGLVLLDDAGAVRPLQEAPPWR